MSEKDFTKPITRVHQPVVPVLRIFNVEHAEKFYMEWLGFKTEWKQESENKPAYFQIRKEKIVLHLSEYYNDGSPGVKIFLHLNNLKQYSRQLEKRPVDFFNASVQLASWGSPIIEITDPFGNHLVFCEYYPEKK